MTEYSQIKPLLEKKVEGMLEKLSIQWNEQSISDYCKHLYGSTEWQFVDSGIGELQGLIGIHPLNWDSNIYRIKIGSFGIVSLASGLSEDHKLDVCNSVVRAAKKTAQSEGFDMLVCRVLLADLVWVQALENDGFFTADVQCPLICKDLQKAIISVDSKIQTTVRDAHPGDLTEIASFGKSAFGRSHLYADPGLPIDLSDKLHEEWLKNDITNGRAKFTLVAEINGDIGGFVSGLWDDTQKQIFGVGHGHIDLIAVKDKFQNQGVGKLLLTKAMAYYRNAGASVVTVSTQATNLGAIKLYQQNGFNLSGFEVTLHGWRGDA